VREVEAVVYQLGRHVHAGQAMGGISMVEVAHRLRIPNPVGNSFEFPLKIT
jgi:hypothetical protein